MSPINVSAPSRSGSPSGHDSIERVKQAPPVEWVCARCARVGDSVEFGARCARVGDSVEFGEMESCCVRVEAGRINPVWA